MTEQKYPQSAEINEYRYIDFEWLDEIAEGLTAGAEKHPGETWRSIPAEEHAARALRHLSMWLAGDRSDSHIINASMRCMMARVMEREEDQNYDPEEIDALREENKALWAELRKWIRSDCYEKEEKRNEANT
ncbi:dATP/dGTP diphosphohydrolase domain-containing protein [Selenomonas sp. oral taxon 136]|uniref:dATP/dGTP diphosphohydrolase domain-containing protein n=1 Tax=Selenomonas sp. oral taxon 136 TaxID=713030 RepID=UPI000AB622E0|nr:dATP/dGTP diphosphohydrolase domain-containing protein [Selenomonas sp. oral taxon 136]